MIEKPEIEVIGLAAFAGGLAKFLHEWLRAEDGTPFNWARLCAAVIAAAFTGWVLSAAVEIMGRPEWSTVAAALGGYMGAETIKFLSDFLRFRKESQKDAT